MSFGLKKRKVIKYDAEKSKVIYSVCYKLTSN